MRIMFLAAVAACLSGTAWAGDAPATAPATSVAAAEIDAEQIQRIMESVFEEAFARETDSAVGKTGAPEGAVILQADGGSAVGAGSKAKS